MTCITMCHGFTYLKAFMDVYSCKIVLWGQNNTMEIEWRLEVLDQAMATHGWPGIINGDAGSQYKSSIWHSFMEKNGIRS